MANLNRGPSTRTTGTTKTTATTATAAAPFIGLEALQIPPQARFEVVLANRILAKQGIIEAYGSVSQRHPLFPLTHFIMSRDRAPTVVLPADIQVYRIDTAEPVGEKVPGATPERFIHSEIYRFFGPEEVGSVVVCHTPDLLPFTIASVLPFKAAINKASFLGHHAAPVFDLAKVVGPHNDTLIRDVRSGAALAKLFDKTPPPTTPKKEGLFRSSSKKNPVAPVVPKARSCVLMRGHGATLVGADIHIATLRAIYVRENARVITALHSLIGGVPGLNLSEDPHHGVRMLGEVECDLHTAAQARDAKRSWDVWVTQVIDDIPGAEQGYHSEGTVLRHSMERASLEEEHLPQTTYRYSAASVATDATATGAVPSPPRSTAVATTQPAQPRVASQSAAPMVDSHILDRFAAVPPLDDQVLPPPVKVTTSKIYGSPEAHGTSAAEVAHKDFGAGPPTGVPTSQPLTGYGHPVGTNAAHNGPAGEIVTVDELAHSHDHSSAGVRA